MEIPVFALHIAAALVGYLGLTFIIAIFMYIDEEREEK